MKITPTEHPAPFACAVCAILFALISTAVLTSPAAARQSGRQSKNKNAPAPQPSPVLKRTTTRHETRRLGYGGSVTIYGAPVGSITVEGWTKDEVDITADVEQSAASEEDLARLSAVNTFVIDDADVNHIR